MEAAVSEDIHFDHAHSTDTTMDGTPPYKNDLQVLSERCFSSLKHGATCGRKKNVFC